MRYKLRRTSDRNSHYGNIAETSSLCVSKVKDSGETIQNPKSLNLRRKQLRKGSMLVEATIALSLLIAIAIILLKSSLDVMVPRAWVINQNLADAYLTYEVARGSSIDFDVVTGGASPWPVFPANDVINNVEIGTLHSGQIVTATLTRTRIQHTSPGTAAVGAIPSPTDMLSLANLGIEMWELQSHLSYSIAGRNYVKSRTVIRTE